MAMKATSRVLTEIAQYLDWYAVQPKADPSLFNGMKAAAMLVNDFAKNERRKEDRRRRDRRRRKAP